MGNSDLAKEAETLTKFKGHIDKILENLEGSSSSVKSIADQKLSKDVYGSFDTAKGLADLYEHVHERLKELSKTFGDQIEAMSIAALIADRGYDAIDAEQAARLKAIEERARKYGPTTTSAPAPPPGQPGQDSAPNEQHSQNPGSNTTGGQGGL
ncbi:hypothetical protein [Streptomyces sp. UNOC14_S4]|uniref:hypothetical protein n=1 Tax=Streptomyces sp. UNOC14_S4 TaxID=2872340 RepID=UPI001E5358AE|nr:hypothetical protein [Streptomyces sp. UNOC14_S4]MCC3766647.1 hypothetical protein [Streptomyces sp. UNOC14_S4]